MKRFFALRLSVVLIALPVLACCESSAPIDETVRFLEANADRSLFKDGRLMVYLHAPIIQRSTVDDLDADTISALTAVVYYELTIDILTKETFKQHFPKGTPQILVSEKSYVGIAVLFNELNLLQHPSGNKALKMELSKIDFTPDYSKPSYVGKGGKVVSLYLQGVDCGFFFIYDIASNTMTFDFIRKDAADRVETELFQTCTSGYKQYKPEDLQYWLDCMAENYQENMKQLGY